MGQSSDQATKQPKKGLWQRVQDAKRGPISDADIKEHTGMTKEELLEWSKNRSGVAGNRAAGTLAMGDMTGLGGMDAGEGYGGWGMGAAGKLKFPPKADGKQKGEDTASS